MRELTQEELTQELESIVRITQYMKPSTSTHATHSEQRKELRVFTWATSVLLALALAGLTALVVVNF